MSGDLRWGAATLFVAIIWLNVAVFDIHPSLPANAIELPLQEYNPWPYLLPQGWSFFTRSPREKRTTAYCEKAMGQWIEQASAIGYSGGSSGFSRKAKMFAAELGLTLQALRSTKWEACELTPMLCLSNLTVAVEIAPQVAHPTICGIVGLVRQDLVPWAWGASADETLMPSSVLKINVKCRH
jgi:antimicrobial peptide system SdpA family protein